MAEPKTQTSRAGGVILAGTLLAGAIIGVIYRQPSIGILVGAGVGLAITIGLYVWDRRH